MVFSVFCVADVCGGKWNLVVEFPSNQVLEYGDFMDTIESCFTYECEKWGKGAEFNSEYATILETERDIDRLGEERMTYYSGERVTQELLETLVDGTQLHIHQYGVPEINGPLPPPRNTICWRLVELYNFAGPEVDMVTNLFFAFDTRNTCIITHETMTEAFPCPAKSLKLVNSAFKEADPKQLGYVTFGSWLELASDTPSLIYSINNEYMWQKSRGIGAKPSDNVEGGVQHRTTEKKTTGRSSNSGRQSRPQRSDQAGSQSGSRSSSLRRSRISRSTSGSGTAPTRRTASPGASYTLATQSAVNKKSEKPSHRISRVSRVSSIIPPQTARRRSISGGLRPGNSHPPTSRPSSSRPSSGRSKVGFEKKSNPHSGDPIVVRRRSSGHNSTLVREEDVSDAYKRAMSRLG